VLTTGNTTIDNLFKKASTISSKHKIIAEWNQNAYVGVDHLGSYPIDLRVSVDDPTYSKSFNSTESTGGWDNGGFFYTVSSTSATDPVENVIRKKLTSLKEIVSPERPDPGIVYPLPYHSLDATNIFRQYFNFFKFYRPKNI
jgi:hypothetical protein